MPARGDSKAIDVDDDIGDGLRRFLRQVGRLVAMRAVIPGNDADVLHSIVRVMRQRS